MTYLYGSQNMPKIVFDFDVKIKINGLKYGIDFIHENSI